MSIASISSTKSGLPSAASVIRDRTSSARPARPRRFSHELGGLVVVQPLQQDRCRVELAAAPAGAVVEKFRASEAHEQDRRVPRPVGNVLDEIEEGRLAPLQVVEDDDEGSFAGLRLEQLAHGPERLLGGPALSANPTAAETRLAISSAFSSPARNALIPADELLAVELANDLEQRPERDSLAVRQAAATDDGGAVAEPFQELREQP